jgi:hypothetical protein
MSKRTPENCTLVTHMVRKGEGEPNRHDGKCDGYQASEINDEPCAECMNCTFNTFYEGVE